MSRKLIVLAAAAALLVVGDAQAGSAGPVSFTAQGNVNASCTVSVSGVLDFTTYDPVVANGIEYLLTRKPDITQRNTYYWYYGTLAMYQLQGVHWTRWNDALRSALLPTQIKEGRFAGSWDPDGVWGGYGGRVYSTAMATLCLPKAFQGRPKRGKLDAEQVQPAAQAFDAGSQFLAHQSRQNLGTSQRRSGTYGCHHCQLA